MRSTEVDDLTSIGMALTTERDYNALLDLILLNARRLTSSDAGSLYLVETLDDEKQKHILMFRVVWEFVGNQGRVVTKIKTALSNTSTDYMANYTASNLKYTITI